MRRLRYLASARRDISAIYHYIEGRTESSATAQRFVDRLRAQCRHIAALPSTLGRPRPELGKDLRTFPFQGYLIVLRYADDVLEIVDIVEGHRDIKAVIHKEY